MWSIGWSDSHRSAKTNAVNTKNAMNINERPTNSTAELRLNLLGQHAKSLGLALCVLAISGCSFTGHIPDDQSQLNTIQIFSIKTGESNPRPAEQWWQSFQNEQLSQTVELALAQNFNLAATEARLRAAQADLDAATAGLFPTLSFNASRAERTVKGGSLSPVAASTSGYTTSAQFSAEYEIDLWSRVRSNRKASILNLQASKLDLQAARISVAAQTATTWVQWVAAQQTVNLLKAELEDYKTNLKLVEFRFKQGSTAASDVLQQRQLVEATAGSLASALVNAKQIQNSLNTLTATPLKDQTPDSQLPALPPMPATGLPAEVLQRRPDVQSAFKLVLAADQRVASAIANRLPQLSLSASLSDQTRDSSLLFDNWIRNFSLNLLAPLFDGGARAAQVDSQKAQLDQALAQYQQTSLEALEEVDTALYQETKQAEVVDSLTKQVEFAEQSLKRLFEGYRNGSVSYLSILNAQQSASSLKRSLVAAQQQLLIYRITLHRAISGGLQPTESKAS